MTEKYILVSDDEYCYTLDTSDENYKTLEDFEKQEFKNAKYDGVDIKDYEDAILESANDNYWDWVYTNHLEADTVNDILNTLVDENKQLKDALNQRTEQCNKYYEENEQLKAQLYCNHDGGVCSICKHCYLEEQSLYYISKCEKGHKKCSKEDVKYCEDFEVKELQE